MVLIISGSGFLAGATVALGGVSATNVTVASATTIAATTAAHAAGVVSVVVTNPDGQSGTRASAFTYVAPTPAPTVTGVAPTSGTTSGGTRITITGTGFASGATVTVGGTAATAVSVASATSISATTPAHAAGVVSVVVTNPDGQSGTRASAFTYVAPTPAPTVTGVAPTSGTTSGGTRITITGTGFASGATVTVGGTAATAVSVASATTIAATTAAHAAGAVSLVVTNPDGQSGTRASAFTYVAPTPAPTPTISSVSPRRGSTAGGTLVTITGTGFVSGATVTFGGTAATSAKVVSAASISTTTPAHAFGLVNVVVKNPDGKQATANRIFWFLPSSRWLTAASPSSGTSAGGTVVTLAGAAFETGAVVTIGGTVATAVTVASDSSIAATTPAHAAGTVDVTVTLPDGESSTLPGAFTYTDMSIDDWMARFGITDPAADDDGDGVNNRAEYDAQTDPTLPNRWYLAEGSTGFFRERLALANPGTDPADVMVTFQPQGGSPVHSQVHVPPQSRTSITVNDIPGLEAVPLSTVLEARRGGVVVERTMMWSNQSGDLYAGHTGRGAPVPQRQWFFAEGHAGSIDTWFSIVNVNATPATLEVRYMLEDGQVVRRTHTMGANSRMTVYANAVPELANRSFATIINSDVPVTADRTMYFSALGTFWKGGTAAAGLEAPALDWFVAEGHAGPFFDEYTAHSEPERVGRHRDGPVPAPVGTRGGPKLRTAYQQPHDGGGGRGAGAGQQRRGGRHLGDAAGRRRTRDVLAWAVPELVRGARRHGCHPHGNALGAGGGRTRRAARVRELHPHRQSTRPGRARLRHGAARARRPDRPHGDRSGKRPRDDSLVGDRPRLLGAVRRAGRVVERRADCRRAVDVLERRRAVLGRWDERGGSEDSIGVVVSR